ncbi:uncharacterized protein A4U43_C07F6810 [Asparagus officinalis]|uniref:Uncharacterized protein n=1 Tax=Asparagus officinalis TaxID=4686 RepID=A0A5P1E9W8_ASPOF|nr:uncharacterized protein A4U43_C07F6810 [Asparagus officinalis]
MGRKKSRPIRSGGISDVPCTSGNKPDQENSVGCKLENVENSCQSPDHLKPFHVEVDRSSWDSDEKFGVAEIVLNIVNFADEKTQIRLSEEIPGKLYPCLRFSLYGVDEGSFRLGHWPVLPADSIVLEKVALEKDGTSEESEEAIIPFFSGIFDGPDEGVSGLVHLVSLKFLTLRSIHEVGESCANSSVKFRVEILKSALHAGESLLEIARQPWRKSMINVMYWLRPEVVTSEAIYRISRSELEVVDEYEETMKNVGSRKNVEFDAAGFYEAIKPSKDEPRLDSELPDLLPRLRPYQRRATYWMVQFETISAASHLLDGAARERSNRFIKQKDARVSDCTILRTGYFS